jgi:ketosteroid isomerase-like protein
MGRLKTGLLIILIVYGCNSDMSQEKIIEQWKNEILETEKQFDAMAQKEGISKAFLAFAAEDAVLMRNNNLTIGKTDIRKRFDTQGSSNDNASLSWKPDFVDVSKSGDLGYTYGQYKYTVTDSLGNTSTNEGVFHTVWKRQPDGDWKFVWD